MSDPIVPTSTNVHADLASDNTCKYQNNPYFQLVTWKDPVATGKVVAGIVAGLVVFKYGNPINWFFHFAYIGLIVAAIAEYSGKLVTGEGFITKYAPAPTESCAATLNKQVLPLIEKFNLVAESKLRSIIYGKDLESTLKAAGLCYINYKLTTWFSVFTLLVTSLVVLFTFPAVYSRNRKEIDAAIHEHTKLIKSKTIEFTKQAQKTIEPYVSTLIEKSGPVGNFVKTQFPTRTAGSTVGDSKATKFNTAADSDSVPPRASVPSSAKTTGASQFPNVPTSTLNNKNDIDQIADDIIKENN